MGKDPIVDPEQTVEVPKQADDASTIDAIGGQDRSVTTPGVTAAAPSDWPVIAGYVITAEIARGGMGRVFAGRDVTLEREIAVKVILPGGDDERFVTESKITARLPHPGIPPVHALGKLANGSRYLVMKLIRGRTLAELLRERKKVGADLSRWVQVFEQIAQAVGFAHAQGIIHRDLKPANVMVGAFGEVQVMDWGLAKELQIADSISQIDGRQAALGNEITQAGMVMGTPAYMAPEQARGEAVDARADVFALGALLTVILTGKPPIAGTTVRESISIAAAGKLADALARLDACGADGELVALAKRCLAAKAKNRPADARAVAEQVAAYRAGVEARLRHAETERAAALVREAEQRKRRRLLLASVGIVAAVLVAGIIGTSVGMVSASNEAYEKEQALVNEADARNKEQERADGETRAKLAAQNSAAAEKAATQKALEAANNERQANAVAQGRLKQTQKANGLLQALFSDIDPRAEQKGGPRLLDQLRARMIETADTLDEQATADPETAARLQSFLGNTLVDLGEPKKAVAIHQKARATREKLLGPDHADTLDSMHNLAYAYYGAGMRDKALALYEETLQKRKANLKPDDPATLTTMNNLALAYQVDGQLSRALDLYKETLEKRKVKLGPDHAHTLVTMNNLAVTYEAAGQHDKALPLYEATLQKQKDQFGADNFHTLTTMNNLALAYINIGKVDKAMPLYEEAVKKLKAARGPDHPSTLTAMNNLAGGYKALGKMDKAVALYEETLAKRKDKQGPDHPDTLGSMNNLAYAYQAVGQRDKAIALYAETLQKRRAILGADNLETMISVRNLAMAYHAGKEWAKALPLFEELLPRMRAREGSDHPDTLVVISELAYAYLDGGQPAKAVPLYEEALRRKKEKLGPEHGETLQLTQNLARTYIKAKEPAKAVPLFTAYMAAKRKEFGVGDPRLADPLWSFSNDLISGRQHAAAETLLRECLAIRVKKEPDAWLTFSTQLFLGASLCGQAKYKDARPILKEAYEGLKAREKLIPPHEKEQLNQALLLLIRAHDANFNVAEANRYRKELAERKAAQEAPKK